MSERSPPRDPSTNPARDRPPGPITRAYRTDDLTLTIRGLDAGEPVRIHLAHKSGAALIAPCERFLLEDSTKLTTRGFDGTDYSITIDDNARTAHVEASQPSDILGSTLSAVLLRGEDIVSPSALRITGDEDTMPIAVRKP